MKRPIFLTIWLVLLTLGGIYSGYSSVTNGQEAFRTLGIEMPTWYMPVLLLLTVVQLAAIAMLWTWKKLGFQLMVGASVLGVVVSALVLGVTLSLFTAISAAIMIGILYLAMKPVWNNFK